MFINEIAVKLSNVGQHGIQLQPGMLELFTLLFADDIALLSSTAIGLHNQLNNLSRMLTTTWHSYSGVHSLRSSLWRSERFIAMVGVS